MDFNRIANSHFALLCPCTIIPLSHSNSFQRSHCFTTRRIFTSVHCRHALVSKCIVPTSQSLNIIIIRNKIILNSKSSIVIKLSITARLNADYSFVEMLIRHGHGYNHDKYVQVNRKMRRNETKKVNIVISVRVSA